MGRFILALFATVLLSSSWPMVASAQEADDDRARQHYLAGSSYYDQGRYEDAAREFREAYRLSERAHLLKNVATSYERARRFADAVGALEEYLEGVPDADDARTIRARIQSLRDMATSAGAEDTQGTHGSAQGDGDLEGASEDDGESSDAADGGSSLPAILTLVGAGVLGVGAVATGLIAHSTYTDLEADCPGDVCAPELESDRDSAETMAVVSTVLTGAAFVGAAIGLVLLLTADGEDVEDRAVSVGAGPGDFGLAATAAF